MEHVVPKRSIISDCGVNFGLAVFGVLFKNPAWNLGLMLIVVAVVAGLVGWFSLRSSVIREVSIQEINANPQAFKDTCLRSYGYLTNGGPYMFGPSLLLKDNDSMIALGIKTGGNASDIERYVSFGFDGRCRCFMQVRDIVVSVVGYVRYVGFVLDAPSHYIEVEDVEIQTARGDMTMSGSQQVRVEIDKVNYSIGELVQFRVFQKNLNAEHVNGGINEVSVNMLDVINGSVFSYTKFLTWASDFVINPGQEVELDAVLPSWHQTDSKGVQVPPGTYTIELKVKRMGDEATLWLKFTVTPQ